MNQEVHEKALRHAASMAPRESCGVVVIHQGRELYVPCRNDATDANQFIINKEDWSYAEDTMGEIVRIVHSHPYCSPEPTHADRQGCEASGLPWSIINYPLGTVVDIEPCGWEAPLIGRQFSMGVHDCYSLARDYYKRELGITLPVFTREKGWEKGAEVGFVDMFEAIGFRKIALHELMPGDGILFQINSPRPNHCAVYLGDGWMLHHHEHKLSSRDSFGGFYLKTATHFLRHKDMDNREAR